MLQTPEKGVYNRLSRRQVLRVLGVGTGVMAVGAMSGCTTKRLEPANEDISVASIPLSKGELLDEFKEYKAMKKSVANCGSSLKQSQRNGFFRRRNLTL